MGGAKLGRDWMWTWRTNSDGDWLGKKKKRKIRVRKMGEREERDWYRESEEGRREKIKGKDRVVGSGENGTKRSGR